MLFVWYNLFPSDILAMCETQHQYIPGEICAAELF